MSPIDPACPVCGTGSAQKFYDLRDVPVHSVLLMRSAETARRIPRGDITLACCGQCFMIWNTSFDPGALSYNEEYEETQGFSPTFNRFHRELADYLVNRVGVREKKIVEIGCGKGEFLALLCELGAKEGVGYDPAFVPDRASGSAASRIRFVRENFPPSEPVEQADFYCCKMTLEHVSDPAGLIQALRLAIGDAPADVYFQVPAVERILRQVAFWDIYYEHCNYFSSRSLRHLFEVNGFRISDIHYAYDEQYIGLLARAVDGPIENNDPDCALGRLIHGFEEKAGRSIAAWNRFVNEGEKRVAIWGAGSKAVSLLSATAYPERISCLIDVNPYKQGSYLPGTGQRIESPDALRTNPPDTVVVMNPVYREEIGVDLQAMSIDCELITLELDLRI